MKFFGVHIEDLESEKFLSASNDQIATWLFLHALCSKQCNGGVIPDSAAHPERFWSRHGISKAMIGAPSPLWSWDDGGNLTVSPYDIDGQSLYEKKVKGGQDGSAKRWGGRTPNGTPNGTPDAYYITQPDITQPDPILSQETKETSFSTEKHAFVFLETPSKEEQFARLAKPKKRTYPTEQEFDEYAEAAELDQIVNGRPDLWEHLVKSKWHHWKADRNQWEPIHDWRKYIDALDNTMKEACGQ